MNKNIISWTHYVYVTITASVLAYVTVMDSYSDDEPEESAISMLPSIDNIPAEPEPEPVEPEPVEAEPEPVEPEPEPVEAEAEPIEVVEAEVVKSDSVGTSGGKLKKKKTKTNNQNKKVKKTLRRK
jgi:hypothetical protein